MADIVHIVNEDKLIGQSNLKNGYSLYTLSYYYRGHPQVHSLRP
jgi:hypothetical protein